MVQEMLLVTETEYLMSTTEVAPITNLSEVLRTIEANVAPSTQKAYAQQLKTLNERFLAKGWDLYPQLDGHLNGSLFTQQVLSYMQERKGEGVSLSTINKLISAVKHDASRNSPHALGLLNGELVKQFVSGLIRTHRRNEDVRKAQALTLEQLTRLYTYLAAEATVRSTRDGALISVGIAAALRSSSIAELKLKDVTRTRTYDGVLLNVRFSKTDQDAHGVHIPVKASPSSKLCPVKALDSWLSVLMVQGVTPETHPDFPLFPTLRGNQIKETVILHPAVTITKLVRDVLVAAEAVSKNGVVMYSSHSLRSTFITLSSQQQIHAEQIARISQHKSMSIVREYDRTEVELFGQVAYLAS